MKKTLLITTIFALLAVTGFAKTEISHDEFKALDGPKVLVHYDDGSTELLEEQEYLERTIRMTQEEMDDLYKVDEGTKKALAKWQSDNEMHRAPSEDVQ
nr:MAG TPA: putative periplasmic protein [Caudoviricetes sp.]